MVLGYSLSGYDNDSFMCSSCDVVHEGMDGLSVCTACGYRIDFEYINSKFRVKRRVYDISYTYDGYCIVSLKFKEACERANLSGQKYIHLPGDKGHFYLNPTCVVKFDSEKRKTRFEVRCPECGNYKATAGATPAYIKGSLEADFCKTDILFGSGNEKSPLIIISERAKEVMESEKLKGVIVEEICT